jgi:hypothetical protein
MHDILANDHEQHLPTPGAQVQGPSRHRADEGRAWSQLYTAIGRPATAEEVVRQLDADPQSRRDHLALYIRARTTLRERRLAQARSQRIGAFARHALALVVMGPFRLLRGALGSGARVAVDALPPLRTQRGMPARNASTALHRGPGGATAKDRLLPVGGAAAAADETGSSRAARAA